MVAAKLDSRVRAIEGKQPASGACRCSWLAVAHESELATLVTCPRCGKSVIGRKKIYLGDISPDDWDVQDEN